MVSQDPIDSCLFYVVRPSGGFVKDWRQNVYLQHLLTGSGTGSSHTPRRHRRTQTIEDDSSEDDLAEPTPGPSQTKKKKKGESQQGNS